MVTLNAASPVDRAFIEAVSSAIDAFIDGQATHLASISPAAAPLVERARAFTAGGKRLRPAFCVWGGIAAGASTDVPDEVIRAAASLDVLHVSALVHDDVMDASDTRRGIPAAHRQFEADHRAQHRRGSAEAFGRAGAILLGDLLLMWSASMFETSGLDSDALARGRAHVDAVRTEVTVGQYLDVLAQSLDPSALARTPDGLAELTSLIDTVVTYKTAFYTVRRPLTVGAALAGASEAQLDALTAYGLPLGRAFQYRDDVLGVFGDEALTGKESGEDIREGKLTLLMAQTFARASETDAARLAELFGRPDLTRDQVDEVRRIITDSGSLDEVEAAIDREYAAALDALDGAPLEAVGVQGLTRLAELAVHRRF